MSSLAQVRRLVPAMLLKQKCKETKSTSQGHIQDERSWKPYANFLTQSTIEATPPLHLPIVMDGMKTWSMS